MARLKPATALGGIGLVALAFLVALSEPADETIFAPFATRAELGTRVSDGDLVVQVDAVRLADEVTLGSWTGTTTGVWLVVDVQLATEREPTMSYAELFVGDRRWRTSDRPSGGTMQATQAAPGLPQAGSFVFEIPAEVVDDPAGGSAVLRFATALDTRVREVVELGVDLGDLPHERELVIRRVERVIW